jgi:hypothetical protein
MFSGPATLCGCRAKKTARLAAPSAGFGGTTGNAISPDRCPTTTVCGALWADHTGRTFRSRRRTRPGLLSHSVQLRKAGGHHTSRRKAGDKLVQLAG